MIPGVLLYRVLFALLNIQDITASTLLAMMRNGVEAVTIIIGIAIGVASRTSSSIATSRTTSSARSKTCSTSAISKTTNDVSITMLSNYS